MKKTWIRLISAVLVFVMCGCMANAGEDSAFPLPEMPHRIDGTVVYNNLDFFEGIEFGMNVDEYADLVNDRFGKDATEFTHSLAYNIDGSIDEGVEWTIARTFIYNEELDMNTVISASFINGKFNSFTTYALGYCEDYDDFVSRAELIEKRAEVQISKFRTRYISDGTGGHGSPVIEIWWNNEYFDISEGTYVWEGPHEEFSAKFLYLPEYIDSEDHRNTGYLKYDTFAYDPDKVMYCEFSMMTFYDAETYDFPGDPKPKYERDIPMFFSQVSP